MHFKIEENSQGQRLDQFLTENLEDKSRSQIQKLIKTQKVLVNNSPVKKNYLLNKNDKIDILPEDNQPESLRPIQKPLDIVFENDDVIVINKPPNLSVHQDINGHQDETLINWLHGNNISLSTIGGIHRPGIVHRLDKDTSGVMIIAKNDKTHHFLQKQFADRTTDKTYLALVDGTPPSKTGTINSPITRDQVDRKKMKVSSSKKARPSITHFKLLETYTLPPEAKSEKKCSLLEIKIETGRTHQIRVHMASIGHPVIGDDKYGSSKINKIYQKIGLKRQFLHAYKLGIQITPNQEKKTFQAELSEDLQTVIDKLY
jgi:23S rRNA pseudouridine1911/1915/1917 synthase